MRATDVFVVDHPHNEASGILSLRRPELLAARGWGRAFWIVSDEEKAHRAVAALGLRSGADERDPASWEVAPLAGKRRGSKKTDDCEALARAGAWIYVFGSQFGSKDGPLDPKRHFVARFNESLVIWDKDGDEGGDEDGDDDGRLRAKIAVRREPFLLHRLVNDAVAAAGVALLRPGDRLAGDHVEPARQRGERRGKAWADRVAPGDSPINVEGATFLPSGRLLLGLRYPTTADGHPLLVEVEGVDRLFAGERHGPPTVTRLWWLANAGSKRRPVGVRELDAMGTTIHVATGDLDSDPDESAVLRDHPEGRAARSAHWTFEIPAVDREGVDGGGVEATLVRRFGARARVEGLCVAEDGTVWYVHDDERIVLERAVKRPARAPAGRGSRGSTRRAGGGARGRGGAAPR